MRVALVIVSGPHWQESPKLSTALTHSSKPTLAKMLRSKLAHRKLKIAVLSCRHISEWVVMSYLHVSVDMIFAVQTMVLL